MHRLWLKAAGRGIALTAIPVTSVICDSNKIDQTVDSVPSIAPTTDVKVVSANKTQELNHDVDSDAYWEDRRSHCGFCRHFLDSPCKVPFKAWSICVERAKESEKDFVEQCSSATADLVDCTSKYPDYFREVAEKEQEGKDDVDDEDVK